MIDLTQKLPLVEKFFSVQGEGYNVGRPAMFIRFSGCNLDCVFADGSICDTPWRGSNESPTLGEVLEWVKTGIPEDDFDIINRYPENEVMVILTGGEPTLAKGFDDLVEGLSDLPVYIAVETNGTIWRDGLIQCDWVTVSPKNLPGISHNNPKHDGEVEINVLALHPHEYRFVITGPNDFRELPWDYGFNDHSRSKHFISPALMADGSGLEWQRGVPEFVPGAVERCLEIVREHPFIRLSLQTHKWTRIR